MMRHRWLIALAAIATALVLVAADANARAGGGFSGGSRGMRTFSAPPATSTAPNTAAPIQRTMTQPGSADHAGRARRGPVFGRRIVRRRIARRACRRLHRRRPVRHAVRPRNVRRHGRLRLDPRPAAASRAGRDRRPAALCLVAAAQFAEPAYAAAHPATGHAFGGLGAMLGGGNAPAGEPLTIDKAGLRRVRTIARRRPGRLFGGRSWRRCAPR